MIATATTLPSPCTDEEPEPPHPWDVPTAVVLTIVHVGTLAAPFFWSRSGMLLCAILYCMSCLGITLGYHRLLTHRSFRCKRWVEIALATMGGLACQGGPSTWVAVHRLHHSRTDKPGDPHGAHNGFWWAHMGWMLARPPHKLDPALKSRFAPDIERDGALRFLDRSHFVYAALVAIALYKIGGLPWLFWGGFVRMAATYHATWLVNSAAHQFGYRSYETQDRSRNCWWVALLTFGEGWHNNHHAFPTSARQGLKPWEIDLSWLIVGALAKTGLVWDPKLPPQKALIRGVGSKPLPIPSL